MGGGTFPGREHDPPFPRSGVVSARRKDRIAVSKRNVPRTRWLLLLLLLLLLNVIYSKQIIIDKDVDRNRIHSDYQKCSPGKHFFQKNQFGLRKTTARQIRPLLVLSPFPNSNPSFQRFKKIQKKHPLNHFFCQSQMKSGQKKKTKITTTTLWKSRFCANPE